MRDELLSGNAGIYSSAFIKMQVHCTEDLTDITKVSLYTQATYFHEYIHFLQDITTTYGLMNICNIVDYIKYVNQVVRTDGKLDFTVPIKPITSAIKDVKANWKLKNIYSGGGYIKEKGVDFAKLVSIKKSKYSIKAMGRVIKPQRVILEYIDTNGNSRKTSLGAYAISENMAYLMEQQLYPGVLPAAKRLPYEAVNILCDHLHPGFSIDPLNVIALCDACLMLFHPVAFMFDVLKEMAKNKYFPAIPDDVYNHIYSRIIFNYHGTANIQQLFAFQSKFAISQMCDYFTTNQFKDNTNWIQNILSNAYNLRVTRPNIMLDLVRAGKISTTGNITNQVFAYINDLVGTPIIMNDDHQLFFNAPKNTSFNLRLKYLWVIHQVYKIYNWGLNSGTFKCEMIDWCDKRAIKNGTPQFTNQHCRYEPWERAKDSQPNDCPFSRLWYIWGLTNEYPV